MYPKISKMLKDIIKINFKDKYTQLNSIEDVTERQEKQKELTANLKKTSELVDPFIKNQILESIQLKIDPNNGWKQLDD